MTRKSTGLDFKVIDPKDIPAQRGGRSSQYAVTLAEFVQSGAKAVELDVAHLKNKSTCSGALRYQVKQMKLEQRVAVVLRQGRVFLLRTAA